MNAIILHGTPGEEEYYSGEYPSASNSHWIPWLQNELLRKGIETHTPEMFEAYKPKYELWKKEFEKNRVDENTILVGHSNWGWFIVRWLSENINIRVNKIVLVAPWLDPDNEKGNEFFDFEMIDDIWDVTIFESTNDGEDIKKSIEIMKEKIKNLKIRTFENYGHFCLGDLWTEAFPELLEEILN